MKKTSFDNAEEKPYKCIVKFHVRAASTFLTEKVEGGCHIQRKEELHFTILKKKHILQIVYIHRFFVKFFELL